MNTALMVLGVLFPIPFIALCYFVGKDKELTKAVETLSNEVAFNKWQLQKEKWAKGRIVTLKESRVISEELVYNLGEDMALEEARKAIIKDMSKGMEECITFYVNDDKIYKAIKVTGIIRVVRGEE